MVHLPPLPLINPCTPESEDAIEVAQLELIRRAEIVTVSCEAVVWEKVSNRVRLE